MAVGNHIEVAPATRWAIELRTLVDQFQAVKAKTLELKTAFDECGGDWANMGALLALGADDAQAVYNLITNVALMFNETPGYGGADVRYLLDRLS